MELDLYRHHVVGPPARGSVRRLALGAVRRRSATAVTVALALALAVPATVRAQDPAEQARREAEATQDRLDEILRRRNELQVQLDRAVGNFEGRRGQFGRLDQAEELVEGKLTRLVDDASRTEAARDAFVRNLYKRPVSALYAWALGEDEVGDAIHRGLMVGYVLDAGAHHLRRATELREELQERRVEVDVRREEAEQALVDLAVAQEELDALLTEIAALERSARQLAATTAARADELERQRAAAATGGSGGRFCPVGSPNSFVDTWGAARSGGRSHQGVDIFAPQGTDLYAVGDGVIERAGNLRLGGITLHLRTDDGATFYYAHLAGYAAGIAPGVRVRAGDVVGFVGRTGNARTTPPHLHWEYHPPDRGPVNPYPLARELCR